jgi:molybdopterin/thiamine biosynthesis adenylyltransferase
VQSIHDGWSFQYQEMVTRNIGVVSFAEQDLIKTTPVAVLGVGGLGGPLALNLAHAGCEHLIIADRDVIDASNLNRQPYTERDIDTRKIDALEKKLLAINPNIEITKYFEISEQNIEHMLKGVKIVALTLDGPIGSIIVARAARKLGIPMVENWAVPMVFARWFTPKSMDYEACYGLTTQKFSISDLEVPANKTLINDAFKTFFQKFPDFQMHYSHETGYFDKMMKGEIGLRSFSPVVWMQAVYLAFEVLFAGVLSRKEMMLGPKVKGFNFFTMERFEF